MKTKSGVDAILKCIMSCCELTPELEESIEAIRQDFEEKENVLKKYGTIPEDAELTDFDFVENAVEVPEVQEGEYKQKYDDMKKKYIERFFGSIPEGEEEIKEEETPSEEKQIDDLFK